MRFLGYLLPLALCLSFGNLSASLGEQDGTQFDEELNEKDWEALYDFINSKRTINVEEKEVNLSISGDVRTEWRHLNEWEDGRRLRGSGLEPVKECWKKNEDKKIRTPCPLPISRNDFDIEFNLRFDYVCERAWAVAHVQYDNSAGVSDNDKACEVDPQGWHGSGRCDDLCLKKAYMGYNVWCDGQRFDIELGRRNLYNAFDSDVQFLSRFDGVLLKFSGESEKIADWYYNVAGFLVDERVNQFAWGQEIGFYRIMESGFDLKYSFIYWPKNGRNRCGVEDPKAFRFVNSQWTMYYHLNPDWCWGYPAYFYGALVVNHRAHKNWRVNITSINDQGERVNKEKTIHNPSNIAWYVGFTFGEVVGEGDWAIDIEYQWVEARAIPDNDMSGIGRGNVLNQSLTANGNGNTNYKGFRIEGLYAVTDNLTLDCIIDHTVALDKGIGGRHRYSKFELEAIYAF